MLRETRFEKQVQRRTAKRIFLEGEKILYLIPCKCTATQWTPYFDVLPEKGRTDDDFEKLVNEYEYYSCNKEVGSHAAFYISK